MAQPAHTLEPEQYGSTYTPRPTQRGIPTFHVHRGRAERIRRAYETEDLAPREKRPSLLAIVAVDGALCAHARGKGRAWPYLATLAAETYLSERTVCYVTKWLERHGLLRMRRTGRYNVYWPLFMVAAGATHEGPRCNSKEERVNPEVPGLTPSSTEAPLQNHDDPNPEPPTPSGGGVVPPPSAPSQAEPAAPPEGSPQSPTTKPTAALLSAVAITSSRGLAAALRRGISVRIEHGTCVLTPRHQWQADLLRPLLRPSDDSRHLELVQAVEIAFGVGTRLRLATPR